MNALIEEKLPQIAELCKKYRVERLYLFGSATGNDFTDKSDIDLIYSLKKGIPLLERGEIFFDLVYALQDLFDRNIDLIAEHTLKNPYFISSVERSKQLLYAA
jgi:predicted nucleotidyltransferase